MRVKNFIAANMNEAMAQVRMTLGSEAVILSNQTLDGQIHLTAAVDERDDFDFNPDERLRAIDTKIWFDERHLRESLEYHGVLASVAEKILAQARETARLQPQADEQKVLSQALAKVFKFDGLFGSDSQVKVFMGISGSGKSTAIAKMATQARLQNIKTLIVSTDNVRAGANNQLQAFANILEVDFVFHKQAEEAFKCINQAKRNYGLILVDTAGINPYYQAELDKIAPIVEALKGDKILVQDAGRNVFEAVETAELFKDLGADYLLPTRLDLTRRIGALISAAGCCNLAFAAAGVNSSIAKGLARVESSSLAKLLLA